MGERVIVRQNSRFETEFLALDPHDPEAHAFALKHMEKVLGATIV